MSKEDPGSFLGALAETLSLNKDRVLHKIVDEYIFPWYEAKTGKHAANRLMRRQVAEQVDVSLSRTLWTPQHQILEGVEVLSRFLVANVFPQSRPDGNYDLRVTVYMKEDTENSHTLSLEDFLRSFVPVDEVSFNDYSS